jgi:hypothetical protein
VSKKEKKLKGIEYLVNEIIPKNFPNCVVGKIKHPGLGSLKGLEDFTKKFSVKLPKVQDRESIPKTERKMLKNKQENKAESLLN